MLIASLLAIVSPEVTVAGITSLSGVVIVAMQVKAKKEVAKLKEMTLLVNRSVNGRGPEEPKLYDMVSDLQGQHIVLGNRVMAMQGDMLEMGDRLLTVSTVLNKHLTEESK